MALQAYSLARDGEAYLSPHFRVQEFRCKDGSDPVFVDTALVPLLSPPILSTITIWKSSSLL